MVEGIGPGSGEAVRGTAENTAEKSSAEIFRPTDSKELNSVAVGTAAEKRLVDSAAFMRESLVTREATVRNYDEIQGLRGNPNVTPEFISAVESMSERIGAKPEHILAAMSFETGGTFSPSITNSIGATGLIQFIPSTARGLGTSTAELRNMTAIEQLTFVEKYFEPFAGNLNSLEKIYTSILSGSPKNSPDDVLFRAGTRAYELNPLDWNRDGVITAREATTPVTARLFGGVAAVQRQLSAEGAVPADRVSGFDDGRWGPRTAEALRTFQAAAGLPQTGALDEATGMRLFGRTPEPVIQNGTPATEGIRRGQNGPEVEELQDALIRLGEMTKAQKATGPGIFGPRTEQALRTLQAKIGLESSGVVDQPTRSAIDAVLGGVQKGERSELVEAIQTRLVQLGFLTEAQKATGPGIFGPQTDSALRRFQSANRIRVDGVFGPQTYGAMFQNAQRPVRSAPADPNPAVYDANQGIGITAELAPRLEQVALEYTRRTGERLFITSGYRSPARQAAAMANLINANGTTYVRNLYANKSAVNEIIEAFDRGGTSEMTRVIEAQVARGTYISNHLLSRAFDVRLGVNESVLKDIVDEAGGRYLRERDHIHIAL